MLKDALVRVVGHQLHLWFREVFKMLGDSYKGFLAVDEKVLLASLG